MTKNILLIFIGVIPFSLLGQQEVLTGKILADSIEGFSINIVNYSKKLGTTNDDQGYFEIPASPGDSIIFSSVQYELVTKIISSKELTNTNYKVRLVPVVKKLEEIHLSDVKLSGNIQKDASSIETMPFVNNQLLGLPYKDMKQPTVAERRIYTASSTSLDLLLNVLSGKLKNLKKIQELEWLEHILNQARSSLSTSFFVKDLGIPKVYISDFLYYCLEGQEFQSYIGNSKKLSLIEFFQEKSVSYKKHKNLMD